ncbi:PREDICTED: putative F-box/LRR-repeat protein At4g00320 [Camelina sativa]|uniref:F-box/LRR-repeat protein At4g00320 n=1 Tax=Camelina sativa TaxID=90675 RepID=A0ABM0YJV3_CAMSA|nr:PREDICTED: putative F-box/LRR-repeat protein At4g00320 [Camelina sativa]XP_010502124.1 PREDICTED: putative F-box/LRR-repeat protein At4g00320 [Camelina sativa]
MGSRKKGFDDCGDKISDLPDEILCHILTFLPTKEAASTTALAKRWKLLLKFVPNLDFDDSIYFHPRRSKDSLSFMNFVNGVLALQENAALKRFHLKCGDDVDESRVLDWIPKVLKRGVLDIDLHLYSSRNCAYSLNILPSEIFVSKTLVRLNIQFRSGVSIEVDGDVSLPKLKTLHLDCFRIDTRMFNNLLSGCRALEELVLVNLMWDERVEPKPYFATVSIPTLKTLVYSRFDETKFFDEGDDFNQFVSLLFDNPNLVYLKYSDTIADRYQQVSFNSLVEAKLKLRRTSGDIAKDKINVTRLLTGICNVKILYLSYATLKVLGLCPVTMPVFENLIQLTIKTALDVGWEPLLPLLNNSPNLQTLVFEGLHHKYAVKCWDGEDCDCEYQDEPWVEEVVDTCLSSSPVKVIKIFNFGEICYREEDIKDQIKQVMQFLKTMPELEQVILYYDTPEDEDLMKLYKGLHELPTVASANCEVRLIFPNLSTTISIRKGNLL